ncbi:hypothetical protein MWU59_09245 [Flavobacteriaceae bacterium F08102]|nr:hypothetical protein [Flavobacteriaceae bacterium F08102]
MKTTLLTLSILLLSFQQSYSQKSKKHAVLLESISVKYEGDMKKNLANGKGKAWGTEDFYEGQFKKGLPHGEGIYTWGNGNIYKGEFSKGKMDGKGTLTIKASGGTSDIIQNGYFKNNQYLGEYKSPYKIIADGGARNVNFQNNGGALKQVSFEVVSNGVSVSSGALRITDEKNSLIQVVNGFKTMTNATFPLKRIEISFSVNKASYTVILDVYQAGNWHVIISV